MTLKHTHDTSFSISFFIVITGHFSCGQKCLAIVCQAWRASATQSSGRAFRVIAAHSQSGILPRGSIPPVVSLWTDSLAGVWTIAKIPAALVSAAIYTYLVPTVYRPAFPPTRRRRLAQHQSARWMAGAVAISMDGQPVSWVRLYDGPTHISFISEHVETSGTPRSASYTLYDTNKDTNPDIPVAELL